MTVNDQISRILTGVPNEKFTVGGSQIAMQPMPARHGEWVATSAEGIQLLKVETHFHNEHGRVLAYAMDSTRAEASTFNLTSSFLNQNGEQAAASGVHNWLRDLARKQLIRKQGTIQTLLDEAGAENDG